MSYTRDQLLAMVSRPVEGAPLNDSDTHAQLAALPGWSFRDRCLVREYHFDDYYETIAFVNALAWMVHREDHHPALAINYSRCEVRLNTHSVGGVSLNDFICAAKADAIARVT